MRQSTVDLLLKHERLINDTARKMAVKLNWVDVDEFISFARCHVVEKAPKWKPERGAFTTFCVWVIRNAVIDYAERQRRLVPMSVTVDADGDETDWLDNLPETRPGLFVSLLASLWEDCSEAAREVIDVCLSTDLEEVFSKGGRTPLIERLRGYLLSQGWSRRKTHTAFAELTSAIKDW